jgi:hypothetical protein
MCKPLVSEEFSDVGHVFVAEIASFTYIPMFSVHQHVEAAIMAAKKQQKMTYRYALFYKLSLSSYMLIHKKQIEKEWSVLVVLLWDSNRYSFIILDLHF